MPAKRPTRADVAREAGVAPSTVTLILNQHSSALGIAESTRLRVEEAARALGYYPNRHIRAMRSGRTGNVGLYLRSDQWGVATGYWATMRAMIERAAAEFDLQILVHCTRPGTSTEEAFARQAGGVVDGVIILNSGDDPIAQRLTDTGMQAVEIGDSFSILPHVAVDGADGVAQAVEHLHERGYKRPVFLNFTSPYQSNNKQRRDAFEQATTRIYGAKAPACEVQWFVHALEAIRSLDPVPDCAVCTSDEVAFTLYDACLDAGLKVPKDLAITGFDCLSSIAPSVTMTSVQTPLEEQARLGVRKLLAMLEGKPVEHSTVLPVSIRVGDTT